MKKDGRYQNIKDSILQGTITEITQIFTVIPKTNVAKDMGIAPNRLDDKISDTEKFRLKEVNKLAELIEVKRSIIFGLIDNLYERQIESSRKKTISN